VIYRSYLFDIISNMYSRKFCAFYRTSTALQDSENYKKVNMWLKVMPNRQE